MALPEEYKVDLNRGLRPREVTVRFNWGINSSDAERDATITFKPKRRSSWPHTTT